MPPGLSPSCVVSPPSCAALLSPSRAEQVRALVLAARAMEERTPVSWAGAAKEAAMGSELWG